MNSLSGQLSASTLLGNIKCRTKKLLVFITLLGFSADSRGSKSLPTLSCSATRHNMLDLRTLLLSLDSKHCNHHMHYDFGTVGLVTGRN